MAKKNKDSEDGHRLWKTVSDSVSPLADREREYSPFLEEFGQAEPVPASKPPAKAKRKPQKTIAQGAGAKPLPVQPSLRELSHGESDGLDKRTAERLRKGKLSIDAKIDLHGMSQEQAHRALNAFIEAAYVNQKRLVQVVTGKGKGILQNAVPQWLNQMPNRTRIISFSHAPRHQGGSGALHVLIKRQRGLR